MINRASCLSSAFLLTFLGAPALAQTTDLGGEITRDTTPTSFPYASLQLGVGIPNDYEGNFSGFPGTSTSLDLNTGFNGEVAIGYKFNDIRTDLSVGYGNYGVGQQTFSSAGQSATVNGKGSVDIWTVMANVYYDIPIRTSENQRSRWSPYIGAGVGYANVSTPSCAFADCFSGGSADAFAWQAKAGLSYRATEQGFVFVEGGYLGTAATSSVDNVGFDNFGAWRINLGWRQGFGGAPKAKAVAVEQPAPTAAPVETPAPTPQPSSEAPVRGLW